MNARDAREITENSETGKKDNQFCIEMIEATNKRIKECSEAGDYGLTFSSDVFYDRFKDGNKTRTFMKLIDQYYQSLGYITLYVPGRMCSNLKISWDVF